MPTLREILSEKGTRVHTIAADATVLEATRKMNEHKIGALVVLDNDRIAGMFTERDVLQRVVALEKAPAEIRVRDVMTEDVVCVGPETDIDDASQVLRDRRIRHLPICDSCGGLIGMVSIGDVNAYHASGQAATIHFLSDYIYGRA